ncbi:MAG: T9SS type A sorting domain-containing protein [Paludibacter sp.]|nr:T9SS type A sorting domain-containing protein [Paludibacter sp.]
MKKITTILALCIVIGSTGAQDYVEFTNEALEYSQNFNTLESTTGTKLWTNGTTPLVGWHSYKTVNTTPSAVTAYTISSAGLVSFGSSATDSTERALGSRISNTIGDITYGVKIKNNTGYVIKSLQVVYTGEQWSYASPCPQVVDVSYKLNATGVADAGFTVVPELQFSSPRYVAGVNTTTPIDGNQAENRVAGITYAFNVNIPIGEYIWLRWYDINDPSTTGSCVSSGVDHQLAIDDVSVTASYLGTDTHQNFIASQLMISCTQDNLKISNGEEIENIVVYNTLGKVMLSRQLNSTMMDIAAGHLSDGVYIAQVITKGGKKMVKRFIK